MEGVQEVRFLVGVDVNDNVIFPLVTVDDVHEEEGLALDLLFDLFARLSVHDVDLDL